MARTKVLCEGLHKVILKLLALERSDCETAKTLELFRYTVRNIIKFHKSTG